MIAIGGTARDWNYEYQPGDAYNIHVMKQWNYASCVYIVIAVGVLDLMDLIGPIGGPAFSSQTPFWWPLEDNHNLSQ